MDIASITHLSSIKKHVNGEGRVPAIVAVIKSCTPNGFGDMTVTLKAKGTVLFISVKFAALHFGVNSLNFRILLALLVLVSIAKSSPK
jgi:hypothetical protein